MFVQPKAASGNTTVAAAIVGWCAQHHPTLKIAAYDPDCFGAGLLSRLGATGRTPLLPPHITVPINWMGDDGIVALDEPAKTLIKDVSVDTPDIAIVDNWTNQESVPIKWMQGVTFLDWAGNNGIALTIVTVVDETEETAHHAEQTIEFVAGRADVLIVRVEKARQNLAWDQIAPKDQSTTYRQITLPRFPPSVRKACSGSRHTLPPYSLHNAARFHPDPKTRAEAAAIWQSFRAELNSAASMLLPTKDRQIH